MALFAFSSLFPFNMGPIIGGLVVSHPHMDWRWVQWIGAMSVLHHRCVIKYANIQLMWSFGICRTSALNFVLVLVFMSETRSSIVITHLARDARRVTGDNRLKARIEVDRESLLSLIKIACTRPLCTCGVFCPSSSF